MDGFHGETAQLDLLLRGDFHELGLARKAELFQLVPDQAAGQAGAVDGQVELLQQIGNAANVILVAVGDEQTLDLILILHHEGEVRDDQIHAVHVAVREDKAAVHDDHIAAALVHGHVLAHFTEAAQRVDVDGHSGLLGLLRAAGTPLIIRPAGAGPLFAGGFARVVVSALSHCLTLFFCLCHSYLQKINHKTQARPFFRAACPVEEAGKLSRLHRNHRIEFSIPACFSHCRVGAAKPCEASQSICSMRPRRGCADT